MKRTTLIFLSTALALALPAAHAAKPTKPKKGAATAPKKIYCWEENGTKICGDALPASAANSARTEISGKTGLTTKRIERTLTEDERKAAELAAQQAAAQQAAALAAQEQQQRLVLSYADEGALNRAYDDKEAVVKNSMSEIQKGIDSIRKVLVAKLVLAAEQEYNKKNASSKNAQSIRDLHVQIRTQEGIQARHRQSLAALKVERANSLATFRAALAPPTPTVDVAPGVAGNGISAPAPAAPVDPTPASR